MNQFNAWIEKRNFKRIFVVYLIAAILCGIAASATVGFIFRDKIRLALQYERADNAISRQTADEQTAQTLSRLAASSDDIYDILLLDETNHILKSEKHSVLADSSVFALQRINGSKFLQSAEHPDAVFRFVKKDELMLRAVFADDGKEIFDEYDEDSFYLDHFQNKKLYTISLLGKRDGGAKAYVISSPQSVPYGMLTLKLAASAAMLLFMLYLILVALWVYQSAQRAKLSAPVWGIITLFTNLAGVLVYVIYKNVNGICAFCGAVQAKDNLFCTECGKKIGITCTKCGHFLKPSDHYCPKCGQKQNE